MVELLVVIAIVAVSIALMTVALPDAEASRLDEEVARLTSLLDMARGEARVAGVPVVWVLRSGTDEAGSAFAFVGLPASIKLPSRWLDERTSAQIVGADQIVLGPEAILPPQRIVLRLGEQRREIASDGLGPFERAEPEAVASTGMLVARQQRGLRPQ